MSWFRRTSTGWEVRLHVQPGAKRSEIIGLHGSSLKLKIQAPPVDGKANEAIVAYIAERIGVPRRTVRIIAGESSREKRIAIDAPAVDVSALLG